MKRMLVFCLLICAWAAMADDLVTVKSVTAQQRYPWNGLVDIVVALEGESNDVFGADCVFTASNCIAQTAITVSHITQKGSDSGSGFTWMRRYIWDAAADVGGVKIDDVALAVEVAEGVQLWENGPYWARCNVGASKPEEYGYYFWWGDTVGYMRNSNDDGWVSVKDGTAYSFDSCPTSNQSDTTLQNRYCINSYGNLTAAYDAARVHLGRPWRMPTTAETEALINNCTTIWTTRNGVWGRLVTGKGAYASKSVFLPASGEAIGSVLYDVGSKGCFWSSSTYSYYLSHKYYYEARGVWLDSDKISLGRYNRHKGHTVRPLR